MAYMNLSMKWNRLTDKQNRLLCAKGRGDGEGCRSLELADGNYYIKDG